MKKNKFITVQVIYKLTEIENTRTLRRLIGSHLREQILCFDGVITPKKITFLPIYKKNE